MNEVGSKEAEEVREMVRGLGLGPYTHRFIKDLKDDMPNELNAVATQYVKIGEATASYDCFNWSIGYSHARIARPPVTADGVNLLYESLGFEATNDKVSATVAVFVVDGLAHHVAVKISAYVTADEVRMTWTSKLGQGLLITHPTVLPIVKYYYPKTNAFWLFKPGPEEGSLEWLIRAGLGGS